MTSTTQNRFITRKRLGIALGVFVVLIVLLGLLGYFWLPGFAKSQLEKTLSEKINRPVTVESIEIKPFALEMTVSTFRIGEKQVTADSKETLFAFDKLYVDLSAESITRRAAVVTAITLESPRLRLVREDEDRFNITDLIEQFASDDEPEEPSETQFSVSNITIKDGHFELIDQFKQSRQKISDINLGIPFAANFESKEITWVEPHFNAKINGSPFSLDGKLRPFTDKREATLTIKLDNVDLKQVNEYVPMPVGISLISGYFDSNLLVTFSQVVDEPASVTLSGQASLRRLAYKNRAVEAPYQAALDKFNVQLVEVDLMGLKPSQVAIVMDNITFIRDGETAPVLSLSKLAFDDIQIDLVKQSVTLDKILLDRLSTSIRREQDGEIDLIRLFAAVGQQGKDLSPSRKIPKVAKAKAIKVVVPIPGRKPSINQLAQASPSESIAEPLPATPSAPEVDSTNNTMFPVLSRLAASKKAWAMQVNNLVLTAASINFKDTTLTKVAPMHVNALDLTLRNIDLDGVKPLDLVLQAKVNQHGSIDTKGSLAWAPFATDLNIDLKKVDLVSLQGWAGDQFNALLTRGDISFKGDVKAAKEPLNVSVNGQGKLSNFNIFDKKHASDLLRWRDISINGLKFINEPLSVDISSIKLDKFYARVAISPEGTLNLSKIVKQDGAQTQVETTQTSTNKKALPVRIGKVTLSQGSVNFSDQFIKPHYRANLTGLVGKIEPLFPNKTGKIEIRGAVDKSAPLEILGTIDPFSPEVLLDIVAKIKNIDLPSFSPYSGKYIGYAIEKGKLSVDVHYQIEDGALKASNDVFLDQLTLGEEIDSPDAPSIPLGLAVSLLKNRHGEINIQLPVKGSLDDPQFSVGDVIFDAFVNLILKAVTAPFALLGSALGGGEELSAIDFKSGYANVEPDAETRLETLSQALIDRPELKLEITGYAHSVNDHDGLKHAILERKVKAQKLSADAAAGKAGGSLEDVELDADQYEEYLTLTYEDETFEKPKNIIGLTKSLPVPEMEALLLNHIEVSDDDLHALAEQRANSAQNWLVEQGSVTNDRIFILGAKVEAGNGDEKQSGRAEFSIK